VGQLESLPESQLHREVDILVIAADNQDRTKTPLHRYVRSYVILPSTIYALSKGPLVSTGVQKPCSEQIPRLIKASLAHGQGGMVGAGENLWGDAHIDDVADLYSLPYTAAISQKKPPHGREGMYFASTGEHVLKDVACAIAEALVERGLEKDPQPTPFNAADYARDDLLHFIGTNSRCTANKAKAVLGWKPKYTTEDMLKSIGVEVEIIGREASKSTYSCHVRAIFCRFSVFKLIGNVLDQSNNLHHRGSTFTDSPPVEHIRLHHWLGALGRSSISGDLISRADSPFDTYGFPNVRSCSATVSSHPVCCEDFT
ncbi:hypothetical protein HYDPIDRAFT_91531, partial [Hydnomerulius pinastri MD-312]